MVSYNCKIKPSVVRKYGTASDVAKLPPTTPRNNPHRTKRTFTQQRRHQVRKVAKAGAGKRAAMALVESDEDEDYGEQLADIYICS